MPSEFHNFSRHMSEEFCNENFTSLSPPNLALCVATVPCKASNSLRACLARSLSVADQPLLVSEYSRKVIITVKEVKKKFASQSKRSKCCPSALTQACIRPCHSLMALSTTHCSGPDHVAVRRCIVCYRAAFKLVVDFRKDFCF